MKKRISLVLICLLCFTLTGCKNHVEEGAELLEAGSYTEAQEEFEKAVKKDDESIEAYKGLGICYWEQQDYENAEKNFKAALNAGAKENAVLYNMLGICSVNLNRQDKAAFYFDEGRKMDDASEELVQEMSFNLITAYEATGRYDLAKQELIEYTQQYPDDQAAQKELEFLNTQLAE